MCGSVLSVQARHLFSWEFLLRRKSASQTYSVLFHKPSPSESSGESMCGDFRLQSLPCANRFPPLPAVKLAPISTLKRPPIRKDHRDCIGSESPWICPSHECLIREKAVGLRHGMVPVNAAVVLAQIAKDISLPEAASLICTESNFFKILEQKHLLEPL